MAAEPKTAKRKKPYGRDAVFVIASDGTLLMPTYNVRKVRNLLRSGKAKIYRYRPFFTIQLTYTPDNPGKIPVEISGDIGDVHFGLSMKSEKHEYVSRQHDNLNDEKKQHMAQAGIRRGRRNRKRYREPRQNRKGNKKGSIAPSLRHKAENQVNLIRALMEVCPVSDVYIEMGTFDTQVLAALEAGKPLPQGTDYQHGPKYGHDTLREAVFYRDGYKCLVCGKSGITGSAILRLHHLGFKEGDRSDRMGNLATVCTGCHTAANHQPGGRLWDFEPEIAPLTGAAFMNTVRWKMYGELKRIAEGHHASIHMTYGAATKRERLDCHIHKSHANDAYCIGKLHPAHRTPTRFFQKKRRNNRCLQKFVDAVYMDIRDGEKKKASALGCGRTNRKEPRIGEKNLRPFRGKKISSGYNPIRGRRYDIQPGDRLLYKHKTIISNGMKSHGDYVSYKAPKEVPLGDIKPLTGKDGTPLPLTPGKSCLYSVRKTGKKKKLLSMDPAKGAAVIAPLTQPRDLSKRKPEQEVPLGDIFPAKGKDGDDLPVAAGTPCLYAESKTPKKQKLLAVNPGKKTAVILWEFSAPIGEVVPISQTGGWKEYQPESLFLY